MSLKFTISVWFVVYLFYRPEHMMLWETFLGGGIVRKKKSGKLIGSRDFNRYPTMPRMVSAVSPEYNLTLHKTYRCTVHILANAFHEFSPRSLCVMCLGSRHWWWEPMEGRLILLMVSKKQARGPTFITMSPVTYFLQIDSTSWSFQNLPIQCQRLRRWWTQELAWAIS